MKTPPGTVESIDQLHAIFRERARCVFRGHSNAEWPLRPKAGRPEYSIDPPATEDEDTYRDIERFQKWRELVFPYARDLPPDFGDALAFAQHHGLATRLLDWSGNPLVATFFAVRENPATDGAVLAYRPSRALNEVELHNFEAHVRSLLVAGQRASRVGSYHGRLLSTRAMDARMLNQRGVFTLHCPPEKELETTLYEVVWPDPDEPLDEPKEFEWEVVEKFIIPASLKASLQAHLDLYGINDAFAFPDADGVALLVNWETRELASRNGLRL